MEEDFDTDLGFEREHVLKKDCWCNPEVISYTKIVEPEAQAIETMLNGGGPVGCAG